MSGFGLVLTVVLGTVGFVLLYRLLGPLDPGDPEPLDNRRGYLTDGTSVWPLRGMHVLIGRGPHADLDLDDPDVGRLHAELRIVGASVLLRDLGSRHGTLVNGRILDGPRALVAGDAVTVGATVLTYCPTVTGDAWLVHQGSLVPVADRLLIGRGPENDIDVPDRAASWAHAEVRRIGGRVEVRDLRSTRGTLLNGSRLLGPRTLHEGDEVTVGSTVLTYRTAAGARAALEPTPSLVPGDWAMPRIAAPDPLPQQPVSTSVPIPA